MKKNLLKRIVAVVALSLCSFAVFQNAPVKADAETNPEFPCAYSAGAKDDAYMYYGSSKIVTYTAEEAKLNGIPAGYEGSVLEVVGTGNSQGVLLDFSALKIPAGLVQSLSFRFYLGENSANTNGKPQLRIAKPYAPDSWIYQPGNTASQVGVWTTETVEKDFSLVSDENGNLNKFELSVRSNAKIPFYIDAITVNMLENDGVAPVITYNGEDVIALGLGAELLLDASAYDAQEKKETPIEYVWEEGVALGENGLPETEGEYTLTLRAKDYFNNVSEKTLTVVVLKPDTQAPIINLTFTKMYVQVGTMPILNVQVSDDYGVAELTKVWSDGALDAYGRLTEGVHTYTVTARDTSGNVAQKTLTVYVSVEEPEYDNVIDEEALLSGLTVTFDDTLSDKTYRYGDKIEKPANPTKETDDFVYTFKGWYNGDEEWDFDTDVILENLVLVSKWDKTPIESSSEENSSSSSSDESEESSSSSSASREKSSSNVASEEDNSEKTDILKGCRASIGWSASIVTMMGACFVMRKGKKQK